MKILFESVDHLSAMCNKSPLGGSYKKRPAQLFLYPRKEKDFCFDVCRDNYLVNEHGGIAGYYGHEILVIDDDCEYGFRFEREPPVENVQNGESKEKAVDQSRESPEKEPPVENVQKWESKEIAVAQSRESPEVNELESSGEQLTNNLITEGCTKAPENVTVETRKHGKEPMSLKQEEEESLKKKLHNLEISRWGEYEGENFSAVSKIDIQLNIVRKELKSLQSDIQLNIVRKELKSLQSESGGSLELEERVSGNKEIVVTTETMKHDEEPVCYEEYLRGHIRNLEMRRQEALNKNSLGEMENIDTELQLHKVMLQSLQHHHDPKLQEQEREARSLKESGYIEQLKLLETEEDSSVEIKDYQEPELQEAGSLEESDYIEQLMLLEAEEDSSVEIKDYQEPELQEADINSLKKEQKSESNNDDDEAARMSNVDELVSKILQEEADIISLKEEHKSESNNDDDEATRMSNVDEVVSKILPEEADISSLKEEQKSESNNDVDWHWEIDSWEEEEKTLKEASPISMMGQEEVKKDSEDEEKLFEEVERISRTRLDELVSKILQEEADIDSLKKEQKSESNNDDEAARMSNVDEVVSKILPEEADINSLKKEQKSESNNDDDWLPRNKDIPNEIGKKRKKNKKNTKRKQRGGSTAQKNRLEKKREKEASRLVAGGENGEDLNEDDGDVNEDDGEDLNEDDGDVNEDDVEDLNEDDGDVNEDDVEDLNEDDGEDLNEDDGDVERKEDEMGKELKGKGGELIVKEQLSKEYKYVYVLAFQMKLSPLNDFPNKAMYAQIMKFVEEVLTTLSFIHGRGYVHTGLKLGESYLYIRALQKVKLSRGGIQKLGSPEANGHTFQSNQDDLVEFLRVFLSGRWPRYRNRHLNRILDSYSCEREHFLTELSVCNEVGECLNKPFTWDARKRIGFVRDMSELADRYQVLYNAIESVIIPVTCRSIWCQLPFKVRFGVGKFKGPVHLLRAIRNCIVTTSHPIFNRKLKWKSKLLGDFLTVDRDPATGIDLTLTFFMPNLVMELYKIAKQHIHYTVPEGVDPSKIILSTAFNIYLDPTYVKGVNASV